MRREKHGNGITIVLNYKWFHNAPSSLIAHAATLPFDKLRVNFTRLTAAAQGDSALVTIYETSSISTEIIKTSSRLPGNKYQSAFSVLAIQLGMQSALGGYTSLFMTKLLIVFAAVFFLSSCSKPLPPQYVGYENFRLEKASIQKSILATDIKLYNPNTYNLQLKSASLDVYLNDSYAGHSALDSTIVLTQKDTTLFPLRMEASAKDMLKHTANMLLNPNVKIRITGSAKAGRSGIFINVPINYEGVQRMELFGMN